MKVVLSRKGFDSGAGGFPSPIIDGVPVSLPIPTHQRSITTFDDLGLGNVVAGITRGRLTGKDLCHYDPMFQDGRCAFGQTGSAQGHLQNNGISLGDIFLFFGLFSQQDGRDRHHRIFGYMRIEELHLLGPHPRPDQQPAGFMARHPHTIGEWNANNCLYVGEGRTVERANNQLRLSVQGGSVSRWRVPPWLRDAGLTYHGRPDRWEGDDILNVVGRGQEFVTNIAGVAEAEDWVQSILDAIDNAVSAEGVPP